MGIRTLIWAGFFFGMCIAAFANPIWGIVGYIGHYTVGPERQWWAGPINALALRYSLTLSACTAIGILLHRTQFPFREGILHSQLKLILAFLGVIWFTTLITPETAGYTTVDHPSIKMTKVVIFCLMLAHVASNLRDLNRVIMIMVVGAFVLGQKAYEMPRSAFVGGRLDTVGGADFAESNFLAAFLVGTLPIIGVQFFRSTRYIKIVCLASGVLATNALVLTRTRGAFLAITVTAFLAALYAPKNIRRKVYGGLILACLGGLYLADEQFLERMATITNSGEERDASSIRRMQVWKAGIQMFTDHPLGVGTGNWYQNIQRYNTTDKAGLDSHSTYVKVAAEQGVIGVVVFAFIVANGFLTLRRVRVRSDSLPPELSTDFKYLSFGFTLSLAGFLLCCGLITLVYMEALWWFLVLPACLERSLDDAQRNCLDRQTGDGESATPSAGEDHPVDPKTLQEIAV